MSEAWWRAVQSRDPAAADSFVFAVRTTGIYCRPTCSARPARRENVAFYQTAADAVAAGFRACKRCHPDQPIGEADGERIARACALIAAAAEEGPDLTTLAAAVGLSPGHFQRLFKARVGLTPKQYAIAQRKDRLRRGLSGATSVTDAIYEAGYATSSRAYQDIADLGLRPAQVRTGAAGEVIRWAMADSSLGPIGVAATERGLCMIEFADADGFLAALRQRFPKAALQGADAALDHHLASVVSLIDRPAESQGPAQGQTLPLDIRGTAFQEKVWRALTAIPSGTTVSYQDLAIRLGHPTAARAVAGACAANTLAVVVPCHRVVRGNGALSGYKWGIDRKQALLTRESIR